MKYHTPVQLISVSSYLTEIENYVLWPNVMEQIFAKKKKKSKEATE